MYKYIILTFVHISLFFCSSFKMNARPSTISLQTLLSSVNSWSSIHVIKILFISVTTDNFLLDFQFFSISFALCFQIKDCSYTIHMFSHCVSWRKLTNINIKVDFFRVRLFYSSRHTFLLFYLIFVCPNEEGRSLSKYWLVLFIFFWLKRPVLLHHYIILHTIWLLM